MLSIVFRNWDGEGVEVQAWVGTNLREAYVNPKVKGFDIHDVVEVQADGDELNEVVGQIQGIPTALGKRVVTYYGDHAKFIARNLDLTKPCHGKYSPRKAENV